MYVNLPRRRKRRVMNPSMMVRKTMRGGNFLDSLIKTVTKPLIDTAGRALETGLRSGITGVRRGVGGGRIGPGRPRKRVQRGGGVMDMLNKAQKLNKTLKEKKLASTLLRLAGKNKLADRAAKLGYGRRRKARMPRRVSQPKLINY